MTLRRHALVALELVREFYIPVTLSVSRLVFPWETSVGYMEEGREGKGREGKGRWYRVSRR